MAVQPHPDPAQVADVGRNEVQVRIRLHEHIAHVRLRGAPERDPAVAVMVVLVNDKSSFFPDEKSGRSVAQPLARPRQGQTLGADSFEKLFLLRRFEWQVPLPFHVHRPPLANGKQRFTRQSEAGPPRLFRKFLALRQP